MSAWSPVKGIVHRYPDRVLLKALHACPVYCRFCFRREMVGPGGDALNAEELAAALDYIRDHDAVWEVILTGGDPLMLSPRRLGEIVSALDAMPHVGVIRFHTRVPVADPERVNDELLAALKVSDSAVWVAVHCNHPDELTVEVKAALGRLADAGIPLVSQSVLLRGVNDDAAVLEALFRGLVRARVKPYYLHHGDLAPGTGHFRTGLDEGRELVKRLRGRVSGLCQPAYVLDIPGGHGKAPIGPDASERRCGCRVCGGGLPGRAACVSTAGDFEVTREARFQAHQCRKTSRGVNNLSFLGTIIRHPAGTYTAVATCERGQSP